jgi:hypothetical protein
MKDQQWVKLRFSLSMLWHCRRRKKSFGKTNGVITFFPQPFPSNLPNNSPICLVVIL